MPRFALIGAITAFVLGAAVLPPNAGAQAVKPASIRALAAGSPIMTIAGGACAACDRALDRCDKHPPYGNDRICASNYYDCIRKHHCKS